MQDKVWKFLGHNWGFNWKQKLKKNDLNWFNLTKIKIKFKRKQGEGRIILTLKHGVRLVARGV